MALEFVKGPGTTVARLGVLPGSFNPPTRAHLALADAALAHCDEVLFVLPRALPHKDYSGVSFSERLKLLGSAVAEHQRYAAAASDGAISKSGAMSTASRPSCSMDSPQRPWRRTAPWKFTCR